MRMRMRMMMMMMMFKTRFAPLSSDNPSPHHHPRHLCRGLACNLPHTSSCSPWQVVQESQLSMRKHATTLPRTLSWEPTQLHPTLLVNLRSHIDACIGLRLRRTQPLGPSAYPDPWRILAASTCQLCSMVAIFHGHFQLCSRIMSFPPFSAILRIFSDILAASPLELSHLAGQSWYWCYSGWCTSWM